MKERVLIAGGGVGGLVAALALGRAGHEVTLLVRDVLRPLATAEEAFATERAGAPQVHQTHGFLARLQVTLRDRFPDVLDSLLAAGGVTMPMSSALGEPRPGDEDLKVIIVRRSTLEDGELRAALSDTDRFDPACRLLPGPDLFFNDDTPAMDPIGGVRPMAGLLNRLRRFTDDAGEPVVHGFHAVGDAHTTTNPLYRRTLLAQLGCPVTEDEPDELVA